MEIDFPFSKAIKRNSFMDNDARPGFSIVPCKIDGLISTASNLQKERNKKINEVRDNLRTENRETMIKGAPESLKFLRCLLHHMQ